MWFAHPAEWSSLCLFCRINARMVRVLRAALDAWLAEAEAGRTE